MTTGQGRNILILCINSLGKFGKKAVLKTTVTVAPNKASNKKVVYKSSNKKIATVSAKGVITGKKAVVTVKVIKGGIKSITLDKTSGTLTAGDIVKLKTTIKTSSGGKKNVVWTSSNKKVATVNGSGKVKAVGAGKAVITVKAADGTGKKASYKVIVKAKNTGSSTSDMTALKKIIQKQVSLGASIPQDPYDREHYIWSGDGRLIEIYVEKCSLKGELSVEGLTALEVLYCGSNDLTSVKVKNCPSLRSLQCGACELTGVDIRDCRALTNFSCAMNKLTSLDVSKCTALINLICSYNGLTSLDVSNCKALYALDCQKNQLTSLNVSSCTKLESLICRSNQIKSLDVSNCKVLTKSRLYCDEGVTVTGW